MASGAPLHRHSQIVNPAGREGGIDDTAYQDCAAGGRSAEFLMGSILRSRGLPFLAYPGQQVRMNKAPATIYLESIFILMQ